jgi:transcriptional regulator with XRE-family HTH domain
MATAFPRDANALLRTLAKTLMDAGLTQAELADRCGVTASFMSEFLNENRGAGMKLLRGIGKSFPLQFLEILDIDAGTVANLWLKNGPKGGENQEGEMRKMLPEVVRRAARAAVELNGCSPDEAVAAAYRAFQEHGEVVGSNPDWWLIQLREFLPKRTGSGTRPATRLSTVPPANED